jgi:hypothetical protein
MPLLSLLARASLYSLEEESGARYDVYDDGIDIPLAICLLAANLSNKNRILTLQKAHRSV